MVAYGEGKDVRCGVYRLLSQFLGLVKLPAISEYLGRYRLWPPTSRAKNNGFLLLFLAYPPATKGHPAGLDVSLRVLPAEGGESREVVRLFGGQGTINVPCWAPDSRRFAFMRFVP